VQKIAAWLGKLGLEQYAKLFCALELLNSMARAKNRCAGGQYELALKDYMDLARLRDKKIAEGENETERVIGLLNPHRDLTPLAEFVRRLFTTVGAPRRKGKRKSRQGGPGENEVE
jgi:hypothetical protein